MESRSDEGLFVHAEGILDLVTTMDGLVSAQTCAAAVSADYLHGVGGTTVGGVVVAALGLVKSLLASGLVAVRLETTGDAVGGVGDSLLDLLLGRLGGVRSHFLLGLCESYISQSDIK